MRTTILLTLTLLLSFGCQCNQPGQLNVHSNAQPHTAAQPDTTVEETSDAGAAPPSVSFTEADFAKHVAHLKKRLPSREFSIVVQPPFVVVGDEPRREVQKRAEGTVKWAVEKL